MKESLAEEFAERVAKGGRGSGRTHRMLLQVIAALRQTNKRVIVVSANVEHANVLRKQLVRMLDDERLTPAEARELTQPLRWISAMDNRQLRWEPYPNVVGLGYVPLFVDHLALEQRQWRLRSEMASLAQQLETVDRMLDTANG